MSYIDISSLNLKDMEIVYDPFYGLPENGTILLNLDYISYDVKKEIPENWEIVEK